VRNISVSLWIALVSCFSKTCRPPWKERRSLLDENQACFLAYDDLLARSTFPLTRQAHRHFYSRSRRTELTS
jgi:hypothetical protein